MQYRWGWALGLSIVLGVACGGQEHEPTQGLVSTTATGASSSTTAPTSSSGVGAGGGSGGQGGGGTEEPPRADVPAIGCTDAPDDVYVTPDHLPTMTDGARGDVVRCAVDVTRSADDVAARVAAKGIQTTMSSGARYYRIAFRTRRGDGAPGVSTARVYLPTAPRPLPLPVVVVGHPTEGIADACAPSKNPDSYDDLALPWAGLGYAVVVPDYAGLGNEGVQGYLDTRDQAQSLLDGARALRKVLSPGALSSQVLAVGFSQGGGAVLGAQAIAGSYGADGDLVGVIAFAPEWPSRIESFGLVGMLENPDELSILTGLSANVVAVSRAYAYFENRVGPGHGADGYPASTRTSIANAVDTLCTIPLGGYLQATATHVGDLFDDTLRQTLLACVNAAGQGPLCVEPGKSYYDYLASTIVPADPTGAKILYVQGLADYVMPAATEAACNLDVLHQGGVSPDVCVDVLGQHETVVQRNADFAIAWGLALLGGGPLPTCPVTTLPGCSP